MVSPDRAAKHRARILTGAVLLILVGGIYAVTVVWQRDTNHITKAMARLEPFRRTLQTMLDADGRLPLRLPKVGPDRKALPTTGFTYLSTDEIRALRACDGPVMVGYSARIATGLKAEGRAVLICEQGQCRVKWDTSAEFAERKTKQEAWIKERRRQLLERGPKLP